MKRLMLAILILPACGISDGGTSSSSLSTSSVQAAYQSGVNVLPVSVGTCGFSGNANIPCVSVTICSPGTSRCQTIPNVLLDTGSYGLRIFSSVISVPLNQETDASGNPIAECAEFGVGSDWGTVQVAEVVLGDEPSVQVPIQVINSTFSTYPSDCGSPDVNPETTGFNGILGVGLFNEDCGSGCVSDANNQMYYSCTGSTCKGVELALSKQVANPLPLLPTDKNGVLVSLPAVSASGDGTASGYLILGVGTRSNNTPSGVTTLSADSSGNFITVFQGTSYPQSFIDSGSNGLFFPATSSLTQCSIDSNTYFCPNSAVNLTATQQGANGSPSKIVSFEIMSAQTIFNSSNSVFDDFAAPMAGSFDWGLPFFLGKNVYVGIEGETSNLGVGPYWAY